MEFKGSIINSKISKSIRESSNNQSRMILKHFSKLFSSCKDVTLSLDFEKFGLLSNNLILSNYY